MPGLLLDTLHGENVRPRPAWLMRQAGRYLPEYRALRAEKGGFLALVYNSEAAAEITIQPLRRYGMDGAILFSDILIVPYAMGQDLEFLQGEGPHLSPRLADAALASLHAVPERLNPIYETVKQVKALLPPGKTMLGFAGSPWTVATYMVAGEGSRDQHVTRELAYRDPAAFQAIIDGIVAVTIEYLGGQILAGAEAVQLFDSWAGSLAPSEFERWVIAPNAAIVAAIKARFPHVPVIGFPKGAGEKLPAYARETAVHAVGLDETIDPLWADKALPAGLPVQGNLDPLLLLAGGEEMDRQALKILEAFADRPHVFNLGHGIGQTTPVEHVGQLLNLVRNWWG
ncbi:MULTISPECIES: uroporphyrinogen decarboxylase [unclassified Novosphingobium]|uniref:uroporphyrinogen decarboxylase n=1 Tax=unclassified Novosphingobium TaxID=2644732 RepID=UPI000ED0B14F|nr:MULTISPECIES: uroporphyrinogen decarboxylase [unclassified Novosphingobium]HCF25170.1 uroporphyrinogen decarboxylase [Novosphingobium sp.]HQV02419.1 uroporphyrinogen decarboxylase [Novosphingobium sp.]